MRRVDPAGGLVAQQEFTAGEPGRAFRIPTASFYDDPGTRYLVTFLDPWVQTMADDSQQRANPTPEPLGNIVCELVRVGPGPAQPVLASPGHTVSDCSTASVWSGALARPLKRPWCRR